MDHKEIIAEHNKIKYVEYSLLKNTGLVRHGFTTRIGGVSRGCFESLNLRPGSGDDKENIYENMVRALSCFGACPEQVVTGQQTHTANIRRVGREDAGKGLVRPTGYTDVDGLITSEPGIMLCTSHADCVPIFLLDPGTPAIGMVHAGWRGTYLCIAGKAAAMMEAEFGTRAEGLLAVIGPSICGSCYEVGHDVAEKFINLFDGSFFALKKKGSGEGKQLQGMEGGKYYLDLKAANKRILTRAGLKDENICVSGLCTFERADLFYSHRRMGLKRGQMDGFIMLAD